jgi:hypothetical protein
MDLHRIPGWKPQCSSCVVWQVGDKREKLTLPGGWGDLPYRR